MKRPRGESEPLMEVHHTGVPGVNEERVAEIKDREQAKISETLTANEVVDRLPSHIFESGGINRSRLIEALRHMDNHMREIETDTVQDPETFPKGVHEGQLFSIPRQVSEEFRDGLKEAGFTVSSNDKGIVAELKDETIVSFLYDSKEMADEEDKPEAEFEESEPTTIEGEH